MTTLAPHPVAPHPQPARPPQPDTSRKPVQATTGIAFTAVLIAALAFGLIRQPCNDIGWHLATARVALETGHWPITNTFSHTHPAYPLDQQYPLFQTVLYAAFQVGGWPGLSLLNAAGWLAVFLLLMRWGHVGNSQEPWWRSAARLHLPWMIALLALQRRMILRPDMFSMLFLACELLVIDQYLRRRRWWIALLPLIHCAWVNSHQLFPLSFAVQALLIIHLLLSCWGKFNIDTHHRAAPIAPATLALLASLAATFFNPLGAGVFRVLANTSGSLAHHRGDVQEFAYLWQRPWELQIALACAALAAVALWRMRRRWSPLEVGLWCGTLVMTLGAVRGLVFFGPISVALLARRQKRSDSPTLLRGAAVALTLFLAGNVVFHRWISPPSALGGTQPGLGQSRGDWPHAAVAFLRANPPPGDMLNLPWSLGSPLIWELPTSRVFVDARLEAYPRDFLVDCMAAERDDATLDRLITAYQPTWIIANHRDADGRARIVQLCAAGGWSFVHADSLTVVLVQETPQTQQYLLSRRMLPEQFAALDLVDEPAELRALQQEHFKTLLRDLENLQPEDRNGLHSSRGRSKSAETRPRE